MALRMIQNNFSGGELSPSLYGRSDLQAYYKGCADAENFIITKEGTLRKRHGISTMFQLPSSFENTRIIPYKYDRSEGGFFILYKVTNESTNLIVKFYAKDGTLHTWTEDSQTIDHRTISNFSGSIKDIQPKQIGDEVWIANGSVFHILNVTDNEKFSVKEWTQSEIPDDIAYNETKDDRSTHWTIVRDQARTGKSVYYGVIAQKDSVNSETSKASVSWSATWQASTYIDLFVTIAIQDRSKWDCLLVCKRTGGSYGELTRIYPDEDPELGYDETMTQIYKWHDGYWYDKTEGTSGAVMKNLTYLRWSFRDENHTPTDLIYGQTNVLGTNWKNPLCVDCFQQRRVFANAENDKGKLPMTLWFSEVGNIDNYYADRPTADDDAFSPTISSAGPAFILFIVTYNEMCVLFTESGLYSVGFSQTSGFGASSCRISKFSDVACSPDIQPVVTEAGIVFVGADNKTIYSVAYDLQENMLKPINRSVLVEHLTRNASVKAIALQDYPDSVIWVVTSDGKACTLTIEKNEKVYSWSHSRISNATFLDAISIGTCTDDNVDRTYSDILFVIQAQDGTQYLARPNNGYTDIIGSATTNVRASLVTLRPESQERTIVGYKKNIKDVLVRVYMTGGLSVRCQDGNDMPLVEAKMDGSLFTGDVKVMPRGAISEAGQLNLVSDNSMSTEILQIVNSVEVE